MGEGWGFGRLKLRLLVLDPFVRLHRIDEKSAARSPRCLPSCASCSGVTPSPSPSPSPSSTTPEKAPVPPAPVRPCAGRSNSTLGAIPNLYLRRDSNDRIVLTDGFRQHSRPGLFDFAWCGYTAAAREVG